MKKKNPLRVWRPELIDDQVIDFRFNESVLDMFWSAFEKLDKGLSIVHIAARVVTNIKQKGIRIFEFD
jgi:hypothetical protein